MKSSFTVYFDGKCPVCVAQANKLRAADRKHRRLTFIDCAAEGFEDEAAQNAGLTQSALLRVLHVRSADGRWYRGAEAIAQIYLSHDKRRAARFWRSPVALVVYSSIVLIRPALSKLGGAKLARRLLHGQARRIFSFR